MSALETCREAIKWVDKSSFRVRPNTDASFENLCSLTSAYVLLSPEQRNSLVSDFDPSIRAKLGGVSGLLAEHAINKNNKKYIIAAIILNFMEGFIDYRENYRRLVLINYAADVIGANFSILVKKYMGIADPKSADYMNAYLNRPTSLNTLGGVGMEIKVTNFGKETRFVQMK